MSILYVRVMIKGCVTLPCSRVGPHQDTIWLVLLQGIQPACVRLLSELLQLLALSP